MYVPTVGRKVCAMLGALAMQVLCLSSPTPSAAQQVTPVNPAPLSRHPYQATEDIADSATCAPQCVLDFPQVPNAKRLVITNVSAQLGTSIDSFVIEGNGGAFFVPKPYPTAGVLAAPVMVYFEPGSIPTARFFVQDATQHTSLIVTFVGFLIPSQ
jgi:hypothetical protein